MPKNLVQFKLADGSPVIVEVEEPRIGKETRVSLTTEGVEQAQMGFMEALAQLRPAADAVLDTFRAMNNPSEINLEFGVKLSGKLGAIFTAVQGEATFKVSVKWKNQPA